LGAFYNFPGGDANEECAEWKSCPHCGAGITKAPGTVRIEKAILDGRTFIGTRNTDRRKAWLN
jgi:hypothetical protein